MRRRILTLSSTLLVAAIALGVAAFAVVLDLSLYATARDAAQVRTTQVASTLEADPREMAQAVADTPSRGSLIQVLDASGQVVASSDPAVARRPVASLRPAVGAQLVEQSSRVPGELGEPYCTANPNSSGVAGATGATGSIVAANDDVTLTVRDLPPGQFGIFAVSRAAGDLPVGGGVLCLGGTIGRLDAPGQVFQADATGAAAVPIALGAIPQGTGSVPVLPGETWNFQAWHRDVVGGGATSNLALPTRVTFQ